MELELSSGQISRLSNIFDNAGQVIFGVTVINPIATGIDSGTFIVVLSGVVLTSIFWLLSLHWARH